MAVYEYKALTADGRQISGIVDAENPKTARAKLRKQGVFPTDVYLGHGTSAGTQRSVNLSREIDFKKYLTRIQPRDVSMLTRQLATLVGAGVTLIEALTALADQMENEKLQVILTQVREKVNEGASLADAMREHPTVFTDLFVNMVAAGEQSGALDAVLTRLADYSEGQVELRGKVMSALTYPAIMMFVSGLVLTVLFVFVIPKITKIFDNMKVALPWTTRVLIGMSEFATNYWWLAILTFVGGVYFFRRWVKTKKGRAVYDKQMLKAPVFGRLMRMVAMSRFSTTLATLLHSGVPLLHALKIVRNIVDNVVIAEAIDQARDSISEGHSIAEPLKQSGEFPPLATHMISVGERSGQLESMLLKVGEAYESEVDRVVSTLTTLLEPIMILLMGGMVLFIALSILLPMLQITQSIR